MKAYILTCRDSVTNWNSFEYPQSLPPYTLFHGFTPSELSIPAWLRERYGNGYGDGIPERVYACAMSASAMMNHHYQSFPEEDMLFMEDDVIFKPDFDTQYRLFRDRVPDGWEILFLGGRHMTAVNQAPNETVPGVLRCLKLAASECVIFKSTSLPTIIKTITPSESNQIYHWTAALRTLMGRHPTYAPLGFIAGQRDGWSNIMEQDVHRGFNNDFFYYSAGKLRRFEG